MTVEISKRRMKVDPLQQYVNTVIHNNISIILHGGLREVSTVSLTSRTNVGPIAIPGARSSRVLDFTVSVTSSQRIYKQYQMTACPEEELFPITGTYCK